MSRRATRMLLVDTEAKALAESETTSFAALLEPTDLVVVNDAATLPASLPSATQGGEPVEVRLLEGPYQRTTRAVLFGRGDYRTPTEQRSAPPVLAAGDWLCVANTRLYVSAVSSLSPRLVELAWPHAANERFALLYRAGRPIQYSYVPEPLALWDVQTSFATRPWAVEMPSAARPLRGETLLALRRRGIAIATLTHAAGLSATGDPAIDAALPLPEHYELPQATVQAIYDTRARGGRIVAVGTSVVRALEDAVRKHGDGALHAGRALAELTLDASTRPRVVSGLLTGIHMPGESHYRLLAAFSGADTLARAAQRAASEGYRIHEFGDAALFLPGIVARARHAAA